MNGITVFNNEQFGEIRTVEKNGNTWFIGKDVSGVLGYERPTKAILDLVDEEDKDEVPIQDSIGRMQNTPVINESGLYSLILSSKLPTAKLFKRWVTSEVLPSIRKHGMYATNELLDNPDIAIAAFQALKAEREKNKALHLENNVQKQQICELQPKASYYDVVLNCPDLISTTKIAKDYGKSAVWLNNLLHELGVQFKQGSVWLIYQKHAEKGYTNTKTHTYTKENGEIGAKVHTYWTQKGRLFIYQLLNEQGILPIIEKSA